MVKVKFADCLFTTKGIIAGEKQHRKRIFEDLKVWVGIRKQKKYVGITGKNHRTGKCRLCVFIQKLNNVYFRDWVCLNMGLSAV